MDNRGKERKKGKVKDTHAREREREKTGMRKAQR
jgi:hypothetical protein